MHENVGMWCFRIGIVLYEREHMSAYLVCSISSVTLVYCTETAIKVPCFNYYVKRFFLNIGIAHGLCNFIKRDECLAGL